MGCRGEKRFDGGTYYCSHVDFVELEGIELLLDLLLHGFSYALFDILVDAGPSLLQNLSKA